MREYRGQPASDQRQPGINWASDEEEDFILQAAQQRRTQRLRSER